MLKASKSSSQCLTSSVVVVIIFKNTQDNRILSIKTHIDKVQLVSDKMELFTSYAVCNEKLGKIDLIFNMSSQKVIDDQYYKLGKVL